MFIGHPLMVTMNSLLMLYISALQAIQGQPELKIVNGFFDRIHSSVAMLLRYRSA